MTLEELKLIQNLLLKMATWTTEEIDQKREALLIMRREIKLKTMDPRTNKDVSGNPMMDGD